MEFKTYKHKESGAVVSARQLTESAAVDTKEGRTEYGPGDYEVRRADNTVAMYTQDDFEGAHEPVAEATA